MISTNSTFDVPVNITRTGSPYSAGGLVYTIEIPDTTLKIVAAVAQDSPINPVALHEALVGTIRSAQAKGDAWGRTAFLKTEDDPFYSDATLYPECNITLSSESTSRTSRKRLKYGRVILTLRALNTFLYEGNRWSATLIAIFDNEVCIGTGSVLPERWDPDQMPASIITQKFSLYDSSCSLDVSAQA
ncbi:MAG: hypothetical protein Q9191_003855 [Dirinaria sp. TL-2023a]